MVGFRVTNQMILGSVLNNFQLNSQALQTAEQQVTSGHTISQPSDDPYAASQIINFHQRMGLNDQLQTNLNGANGWLSATDAALGSMQSLVQRARQLAIQGANDTLTSLDRQHIALEVHQILLNMVDAANSKFGDQFVFGGTKTTTQPFVHDGSTQSPNVSGGSPSPVKYFGDTGAVTRQIDQAAQLGVNVDGTNLTNVFQDLSQLEYDLNHDQARLAGDKNGINPLTDKTSGNPATAATFSINGVRIGTPVTVTLNGASHSIIGFAPNTPVSTVVTQINAQSGQSGVTASVDHNGVLVLQLLPGATQKSVVVSDVDQAAQDANGLDLTGGTGQLVPTGGSTRHDLGLNNGMESAVGTVDVFSMDADLATFNTLRAQVGAKVNRVQEGTQRLSGLGVTLKALDSDVENVDMAQAISNLATRQTAFQAALSAAAKVLPPTLLDFLK